MWLRHKKFSCGICKGQNNKTKITVNLWNTPDVFPESALQNAIFWEHSRGEAIGNVLHVSSTIPNVSYNIIQNWLESLFVFLGQSKQLSPQVAADRKAVDQDWTLARVDIQELQQIVGHNL